MNQNVSMALLRMPFVFSKEKIAHIERENKKIKLSVKVCLRYLLSNFYFYTKR